MNDVLLVSMPCGALERPALGISLLKAGLARRGVTCHLRYLTFLFAQLIGEDDYRWLARDLPYTAFAGDWLFTGALYGPSPARDESYIEDILRGTWRLDPPAIDRLLAIRAHVEPYLERCLQTVPWHDYALVGFTSTFEQNIASLALARRLKQAHPGLTIAFGGANWEGEMGLELHRQFPFVDIVCSGEADESFPLLVEAVRHHRPSPARLAAIPGIIYRHGADSLSTGSTPMIGDLDRLPTPDFADYFAQLDQAGFRSSFTPTLLLETSRGCWWGAKSHCTFCGLNGGTMAFRSKSAHRALAEIDELTDRWQLTAIAVVDNILDMRYFDDLLPALAARQHPLSFFYEVKANLTRHQIELLRHAGIHRIQPGLESLSDHILTLMRKGTTGLRNIQLLKWCREYGIHVDWNILYGFPGETRQDYQDMLRLLPSIRFLQPPGACGPIRLDRFSPNFEHPETFGFTNVRPMAAYRYLYPVHPDALARIAYYFDHDYLPGADPTGYAAEVIAYARDWKQHPDTGALRSTRDAEDSLVLVDSRSCATQPQFVLSGLERAAYEFCDAMHTPRAVAGFLHTRFPSAHVEDARVLAFLRSLVANRLMVTDGTRYLSLAIPTPSLRQQMIEQFETATALPRTPASAARPDRLTLPLLPVGA